jgi:hypothetical protein
VVDGVLDDVVERGVVLLLGLDHLRPVAPAEEVILAAVSFVEGPGIAAVQVPHPQVEVRLGGLDQEVVVVSHQAADVHPPPVAPLDPPENLEEDDPVRVVAHDRGMVVPAGHDVVASAGAEVSAWPSHVGERSRRRSGCPAARAFWHGSGAHRSRARHEARQNQAWPRGPVGFGLGRDLRALEVLVRRAVVPFRQRRALARLALTRRRTAARHATVEHT